MTKFFALKQPVPPAEDVHKITSGAQQVFSFLFASASLYPSPTIDPAKYLMRWALPRTVMKGPKLKRKEKTVALLKVCRYMVSAKSAGGFRRGPAQVRVYAGHKV